MATKKVKPKNIEEDTNRTATEMKTVQHLSRDDAPADEGNADEELEEPDSSGVKLEEEGGAPVEEPIVEELVELEAPAEEYDESDDPRAQISKNFQKKHRNYEEGEQKPIDNDADPVIESDPGLLADDQIEIKINQEVRLVDRSKIDKMAGDTFEERVVAYQKQLAVDDGFQRNAAQKATLDQREVAQAERERLWNEQQAALPSLDAPTSQPPADLPTLGDQTIEQLATEYQEAVYEGDESAPKLLTNLLTKAAGQQQPTIDVEKLKSDAADEFEKRAKGKKIVRATRLLFDDHPELDRKKPEFDQRLYTAVNDETDVVERQNPDFEPQDVINEAWRRVVKWKGGYKTDTMNEKLDSKRQMNRPRATNGRFGKPPEPPAKTGSDYVNSLKEARGQI